MSNEIEMKFFLVIINVIYYDIKSIVIHDKISKINNAIFHMQYLFLMNYKIKVSYLLFIFLYTNN